MTASPAIEVLLPLQAGTSADEALEATRIRAAQAGDMAAFEWIVRQHEERLFGFCCRWLRCVEDAREVCQDAFVRAWQALPEFEGRAKLSTWLYQIALNLCRDRAKSRASHQRESTTTIDAIEHPLPCPQSSPDVSAEWRSEMQKLERGLAVLPEKLRAALILNALEGLSHEECAEVLNCSLRGAEGRVYRARQMLMKWWDEER
ncbi:MAG TPA: RNA polymerase sigma factor [Prosthecobacter sp.]|jgi:RNA polymerase sigma factor (sigma-70 family)|nr:RNA polymerase sigma factor [Prosthecobacter sp.]